MRWKLTLSAIALALGLGFAIAQQIAQNQVSGNECWNSGQGPGGPSTGFLCANVMRNGTALSVISGSGSATTQATNLQSTLYWKGTAPTTWTVTTPANAFDGEILTLATDTTLTSMVTLTPTVGQSLDSTFTNQTLTAKTSVEWQYQLSTTTWFELR